MTLKKRGFTLIEMLVVISVGSLLMALSIQVLERALTISSNTAEQLNESRNLNRLADQFRHDMHLATVFDVESAVHLLVRQELGSVIYSYVNGNMQRVETKPDGAIRYELYNIGQTRTVSFSQRDQVDRVIMTIETRTSLKHAPTRTERVIVAVMGRLVTSSKQQGVGASP